MTNPNTRDRNADLNTLAVAVVEDRLSYEKESTLTQHVVDHPDLLHLWSRKLTFVPWSDPDAPTSAE